MTDHMTEEEKAWAKVVAQNLRRIRREMDITQEALANAANVDRTYISKLEKGGSLVGLAILIKLSGVLQAEPADFLQRPTKRAAKKS